MLYVYIPLTRQKLVRKFATTLHQSPHQVAVDCIMRALAAGSCGVKAMLPAATAGGTATTTRLADIDAKVPLLCRY